MKQQGKWQIVLTSVFFPLFHLNMYQHIYLCGAKTNNSNPKSQISKKNHHCKPGKKGYAVIILLWAVWRVIQIKLAK